MKVLHNPHPASSHITVLYHTPHHTPVTSHHTVTLYHATSHHTKQHITSYHIIHHNTLHHTTLPHHISYYQPNHTPTCHKTPCYTTLSHPSHHTATPSLETSLSIQVLTKKIFHSINTALCIISCACFNKLATKLVF